MRRIFSGVQPTSDAPHIGNYAGAFRQWVDLQKTYEALYCVVDLHSMTVPWNPKELRENSRLMAAVLLALGIEEDRSVLFVQSDVSVHTELAWILTCISRMGELRRMTQFKEKSRGIQAGAVGAGLLAYPILMAADVLAYRAEVVPVGDDQRQHLELMRDLAERFNREFGEVFPLPEAHVPEGGSRIMALDDPGAKMSKTSERPTGNLWMVDPPDVVRNKIKTAVTDSGRDIRRGPDKPAISNLLEIFSAVSGRSVPDIEAEFEGKGYAEFKETLTNAVIAFLEPFQSKLNELTGDSATLDGILEAGAEKARELARGTMALVREAVGLRTL